MVSRAFRPVREDTSLRNDPTARTGLPARTDLRENRIATDRVSVVVPVHNEAPLLESAVRRISDELAAIHPRIELIVVENGSTDGSDRLADGLRSELPNLTVLHLTEADYGAAMRAGLLHAKGDWRVNFDIDFYSADFVSQVLNGGGEADVVLASKRAEGSRDERTFVRRMGTRVFNGLLGLLFRARISDTHGIKAIRKEVVDDVVPDVISRRDLFDTELVLRAERAGYRIRELPTAVRESRPTTRSLLRRVPRTIAGLLRLRRHMWREERMRARNRGRTVAPRST